MKRITKILALTMALAMLTLCLAACGGGGGGDSYTDYSDAYKKTAGPGSLNVEFGLMITADDQEMESNGNMKMDSDNNVYYEMTINEKQILQYVTNGEVHTIVDGQEMVTSIEDKESSTKRANPDGEVGDESIANEKVDESGFNIDRFMEEFSGLMEAGKIKEMGVLDPIPSRYIQEITAEEDGNDIVYNITFPEEFLEKLLDTMIEEQTADTGGITFDNLRDFSCISKENVDGYLYYIQYKGYTTVNVPGEYMTDGEDEVFDLGIDLQMTIKNPGTAVTVEIPE